MKIDRLIGILSILLQHEHTTAPELAKRFEVSRRTIQRDIEDLCMAGIPIQTTQGVGGGIRVMDGYQMERTLLTSKDLQMIIAGLRGLDSVNGSNYYSQLMEKIKVGSSEFIQGKDSILIDLSSWSKEAVSSKISLIQEAIEARRCISFVYYSPKGEGKREIEPYYLIFKWSSWYIWGWCCQKEDFRLFKLSRMEQLQMSEQPIMEHKVAAPELNIDQIFRERICIEALFEPQAKWRVIEEYGANSLQEMEDGRFLFRGDYSNWDNLIAWLLSFGNQVQVLSPRSVQEELLKQAKQMICYYEEETKHEEMV